MRTFKDANQTDWALTVNVTTRKKVQADTGFDLFGVVESAEIEKLEDPALLVAVVFSLCEEQAKKSNTTPEQFAEAMAGDALDSASEALFGAVADFFPKSRRTVMTAALEKGRELQEAATSQVLAKIAATTVDSLLPSTSKGGSTSSPVSSESTPVLQI